MALDTERPDWLSPSFAPSSGPPVRSFSNDPKQSAHDQSEQPVPPLFDREYAHRHITEKPNERSDFTETIYWHPVLVLPAGKSQVSFELPDSLTTFQATAFGHTLDGRLGAVSTGFASRLPFSIEPKVPIEVTAGDLVDLPVTIANDSDSARPVNLQLEAEGLSLLHGQPEEFQLAANQRTRRLFRLKPTLVEGEAVLLIRGETTPFSVDRVRRTLHVVPDGFPVQASASGTLHRFAGEEINLPDNWVPGTLKLQVRVFPSILADLQSGLESMLQEPHGCFEQTSSSSYPNLLVLEYLRTSSQANPQITRRALELLDYGYKRLVTYECDNPESNRREGYNLFGGRVVPSEWLTAYGLMQFRDLSRVYDGADAAMVERTRRFLLSRRDGKGGFGRGDAYAGSAPDHIFNAYTLWALTESSGRDDLGKELTALTEQAQSSNDPYFLALVANCLINRNSVIAAIPLLKKLAAQQKPGGVVEGAQRSITYSSGHDLQVETTSLAVLAWIKAGRALGFRENSEAGIRWIGRQRTWSGGFGGTQATILALKALTAVTRDSRSLEAGDLIVYVGDKAAGRKSYPAGVQDVLGLGVDDAGKLLKPGKNAIRIEITSDQQLPYTLGWSYQIRKPTSADRCPVQLTARLDRTAATEGETVRLTATFENKSGQAEGMAVAILGLPAGLTLPEDMKQLKEATRLRKGQSAPITAWEMRGRELVLYWSNLERDQKIAFRLDLICRVPGEYLGPASRAYLYYNAEQKCWIEPLRVAIKPKAD
ncbi:MAG TPA: alpha-2-macroglobulin family protein [Gemmataceae bacterium]|nr:alpha-2-macroglobulin family protein [Gemmataceae bacterium]